MSEAILRGDPNDDLEGLIDDAQKYFKGKAKNIENRINRINELEKRLNQKDDGKVKSLSRVKGIAKGVATASVKTAADVELIASQEDPLMGFEGMDLLDRIKKGITSKEKVTEEEGSQLVDAAAKMKDEFSHKLDFLEKRINTLDKDISTYEKAANKEKSHQSIGKSKMVPINDLSEAYNLINEMYQDLTQRFDSLEKKLDEIERKIEKEIPGIKLELSSEAKKSILGKTVDVVKDNKVNMDKANFFPDDLDDFTYALMEGICGKEHMILEKEMPDIGAADKDGNEQKMEEPDTLLGINQVSEPARGITIKTEKITGEKDNNHDKLCGLPLYYAISNDKVVLLGISENNRAYIASSFGEYPSLAHINTIQGKESIAKAALESEGLKENIDFKFTSIEELQNMAEKYNEAHIEHLNDATASINVCENEKHRIADKGKIAANRTSKKNKKKELAL